MRPGSANTGPTGRKRRKGDTVSVLEHPVVADRRPRLAVREPVTWTRSYVRWAALTDCACGLLAGALALYLRFVSQQGYLPVSYFAFGIGLPALWCASVALAGGYESRVIGAALTSSGGC